MNHASRAVLLATLALFPALQAAAQEAPDAAEVNRLLAEFLAGASRNDAAVHDRFWADDLIYTGSAGRRVGKRDILRDVRSAPAARPGDPVTTYRAEEVRVQQYGEAAIVAFRLVGTTAKGGATSIGRYLNTGTLVKRAGGWQAVAWQATRLPVPEEEAKGAVTAADAALDGALREGDGVALESALAEGFVWVDPSGAQLTRQDVLDRVASGRLEYPGGEGRHVTVSLHGDAAVVSGVSTRRRSAPAGQGAGERSSTAIDTTVFVHEGGSWTVVAKHSSRP